MTPDIRIQAEDFDLAEEVAKLRVGAIGGEASGEIGAETGAQNAAQTGAIVTFTGLCRDEGGQLAALELEHYPGMAEAEIRRIAEAACARWPLTGLTAIHRHGKIFPGENIVLVIAASAHRQTAFEAASFLMDFLKTRAPFWKKEHLIDGSQGQWIEAREEDDEAVGRWEAATGSN